MRLAIMQPYVFPYIGYFQLIASVNKFVVYDDVNFIKQGWINRNRILLNEKDFLFTIPLENASSFKKINEICIHKRLYHSWKSKFYRSLVVAYSKAPFFGQGFSLLEKTLNNEFDTISKLATNSIRQVCNYLEIDTIIGETSAIYNNSDLSGKERVVDICKKENAEEYVNVFGGMELYPVDFFRKQNIHLYLLKAKEINYKQFEEGFIPNLSIIDILMFNSKEKIRDFLKCYELL